MEKYKIFLDSNVFISGLYSSQNAPGKILDYFVASKIDIFILQKVLAEIIRVAKEKMPDILPGLNKFLTSCPPIIIKDPSPQEASKWHSLINKEDALILEAARKCQPDYLVTGDRHFFSSQEITKQTGAKIVKPVEFIKILEK